MLLGIGCAYVLARRMTGNKACRGAVGVAFAAAFLLTWVNGAVGIIGSEDNDANLPYFGVLAFGIVGAGLARFRARGMALAMLATAIAQASVAVVALARGLGSSGPAWPRDILFLTAFFTALWLLSARVFRVVDPKSHENSGKQA